VGARLQLDGKLPYFYRWKPADGVRYYDPVKFDTSYASPITASPFFHEMLYPLADMQQRDISRIWLMIEWLLFTGSVCMAYLIAVGPLQRLLVLGGACVFPFTEAWLMHIQTGQIYLVFPLYCFLFLYLFQKKGLAFFAGLVAIICVLSRPTSILFFVPFLFLKGHYRIREWLSFFVPAAIFLIWIGLSRFQRGLWMDYFHGISAHVRHHLSGDSFERNNRFEPVYLRKWEGLNNDSIQSARLNYPFHLKTELSGVPVFIQNHLHFNPGAALLNISLLIALAILLLIFFRRIATYPGGQPNIYWLSVFGFSLFMLVDFFSPILRSQYYGVEWIFPVLLSLALYRWKYSLWYFLIFAGLLLNITDTALIVMRHTLGELVLMISVLKLAYENLINPTFNHSA
jgi:hypothetical protein